MSDIAINILNKSETYLMETALDRDEDHTLRNHISIYLQKNNADCPARYLDFIVDRPPIPPAIKEIFPHSTHEEILPYLAVYDLLNNRYIMKMQGDAYLHVQFAEYKKLYGSVHGFKKNSPIKVAGKEITIRKSDIAEMISEALQECCGNVPISNRLTYEEIRDFRQNYKEDFIKSIISEIIGVQAITDTYDRKERFKERIRSQIKNVRLHANFSYVNIVEMIIARLGLPDFSELVANFLRGEPGTYINKTYHALHRPISKAERWKYFFVKERKND
jgi:hypothetical protein